MATRVRKVNYVYIKAPNRPGQATRILTALRNAGVNLLAFSGFPAGTWHVANRPRDGRPGRAQASRSPRRVEAQQHEASVPRSGRRQGRRRSRTDRKDRGAEDQRDCGRRRRSRHGTLWHDLLGRASPLRPGREGARRAVTLCGESLGKLVRSGLTAGHQTNAEETQAGSPALLTDCRAQRRFGRQFSRILRAGSRAMRVAQKASRVAPVRALVWDRGA